MSFAPPDDAFQTIVTRLGLGYAVPQLRTGGISSMAQLADLEAGRYDTLGIFERDRAKLTYLITSVQGARKGVSSFISGASSSPSAARPALAPPPSVSRVEIPAVNVEGGNESADTTTSPATLETSRSGLLSPAAPLELSQSLSEEEVENEEKGQHSLSEANVERKEQDGDHQQVDAAKEGAFPRIAVAVRKRPLSQAEQIRGDCDAIDSGGDVVLVREPRTRVDCSKEVAEQVFRFDRAFGGDESNAGVYGSTVARLVPGVFEGQRSSVFAFGQTGSGKTHTLLGAQGGGDGQGGEPGLYALAAADIFQTVAQRASEELEVGVAFFEVYGKKLFDLLNERTEVKCMENCFSKVQILGLQETAATSVQELLRLVDKGHACRSVGETAANAQSSRSHAVLRLRVLRRRPAPRPGAAGRRASQHDGDLAVEEVGKMSFIDLAGSERGSDTSSKGGKAQREGAEINTSLLALKEVIRALDRGSSRTPFRGSKLTQVLKDSLVGEGCRTVMVACASPSSRDVVHTLNTLRYANRVKDYDHAVEAGASSMPVSGPVKKTRPKAKPFEVLAPSSQRAPATRRQGATFDRVDENAPPDILSGPSYCLAKESQKVAGASANQSAPHKEVCWRSAASKEATKATLEMLLDAGIIPLASAPATASARRSAILSSSTEGLVAAHKASNRTSLEILKANMRLNKAADRSTGKEGIPALVFISGIEANIKEEMENLARLQKEVDRFRRLSGLDT